MNAKNDLFLKEFNYYKEHPEDYKIKKEVLIPITVFLYLIGLIALIIWISSIDDQLNKLIYFIPLAYLATAAITIFLITCHFCRINKRVLEFNKMVYNGKVSDLFSDINHPVLKKFKETLINDLNSYNGIRALTAYNIYYHMTDARIRKLMQEQELANKAMQEIEQI